MAIGIYSVNTEKSKHKQTKLKKDQASISLVFLIYLHLTCVTNSVLNDKKGERKALTQSRPANKKQSFLISICYF